MYGPRGFERLDRFGFGCRWEVPLAEPVILGDLVPRPVSSYCELWGKDRDTLNAWCKKGWVPGAFKHPSGEWWVRPLELLQWEPGTTVEEPSQPQISKLKAGKRPIRLVFPEEKTS